MFNIHTSEVYTYTYVKDNFVTHILEKKLTSSSGNLIKRGWISPERDIVWVEIPKNGSNSISHELSRYSWKSFKWHDQDISHKRAFAFTRCPLQRFKGCVLELCFHHLWYNKCETGDAWQGFDEWFENVGDFRNFENRFNIHFIPQISFFMGLDIRNIELYDMGDKVNGVPYCFDNTINITAENEYKKHLIGRVEALIAEPGMQEKLQWFYEKDFVLHEKKTFSHLIC